MRRGFTLVELMVSIFLIMLVMYGVNQVFSTTSATVGTNTAISNLNRDARATQGTMQRDIGNIAADGPFIVIRSEQLFRHQNLSDYTSDPTQGNPNTADLTGSGSESTIRAAAYGFRSHRLDRLSFFTRQQLQRQTGNNGTFVADMTTPEQYVWYGQLEVADNTPYASLTVTSFQGPGTGSTATNPNNFFAEQWALGRMATGLVRPNAGTINDRKGVSQVYIAGNGQLSPLSVGSQSTDNNSVVQESRYDLAGTSIQDYSTLLSGYITANPANAWWVSIMGGGPTTRFQGMNYANRPLDAKAMSRMAPVLASACSHFVVEYAGDFLNQDATTGAVTDTYKRWDSSTSTYTAGATDGQIDFVIPTTGPKTGQRQIRWYGLPRNTSGNTTLNYQNGDVVPLRDLWQTSTAAPSQSIAKAPFERTGGTNPTGGTTNILPSEAPTPAAPLDYLAFAGGMGSQAFYVCAWAPTDTVRPKMYRIIMTLEDVTHRLPDGQTYEYVFSTP